jgi:hypothetical protein
MSGSEKGCLLDFGAVFDFQKGQLGGSECLDVCGRHAGVGEFGWYLERVVDRNGVHRSIV